VVSSSLTPPLPIPPLSPYTTLFRSPRRPRPRPQAAEVPDPTGIGGRDFGVSSLRARGGRRDGSARAHHLTLIRHGPARRVSGRGRVLSGPAPAPGRPARPRPPATPPSSRPS